MAAARPWSPVCESLADLHGPVRRAFPLWQRSDLVRLGSDKMRSVDPCHHLQFVGVLWQFFNCRSAVRTLCIVILA